MDYLKYSHHLAFKKSSAKHEYYALLSLVVRITDVNKKSHRLWRLFHDFTSVENIPADSFKRILH